MHTTTARVIGTKHPPRRTPPGSMTFSRGGSFGSFSIADIEKLLGTRVLDPVTGYRVRDPRVIPYLVTKGNAKFLRFKFTLDKDKGLKLWQSSVRSRRMYFSAMAVLRAAGVRHKSIKSRLKLKVDHVSKDSVQYLEIDIPEILSALGKSRAKKKDTPGDVTTA